MHKLWYNGGLYGNLYCRCLRYKCMEFYWCFVKAVSHGICICVVSIYSYIVTQSFRSQSVSCACPEYSSYYVHNKDCLLTLAKGSV